MKDTGATELRIESTRVGSNGTYQIVARLGDDVLAVEKIDTMKPKARDGFAERLCKDRPGLDRAAIDRELLALAAAAAKAPEPMGDAPEIDVSRVVRPELFHTEDVSGVALPIASAAGTAASARWVQYLRWHADGRRERRELSPTLDLPGGGRLWVHPIPGDPMPTMLPAWSQASRQAWLAGAPAPDPVLVFQAICERIAHFLEFPPGSAAGYAATLALWVILTYVYVAWRSLPYLSIGGPMGSGKTTVFNVIARLVFRSIPSSNMTAPCLFRTLHDQGGTLLLDEAERLRDGTPDVGEIRSVLLSGYKAGSPAYRLEKVGDSFKQIAFDVYGPKALASIANPPPALASRCIRMTMFRVGSDSPKPRRRLDAEPQRWQSIRDDLYALALEHGPAWIELASRSDACPASLSGRDYELWSPLIALADWLESHGAKGLTVVVAKHAEATAVESHDDTAPEADETLLRIVAIRVVTETADTLKPGDVLKSARDEDPETFKKWTAKGVANALAKYGVKTHRGTGNTGRTYRKVTLGQLHKVANTYGLDLGLPDASQASHAPQGGDSRDTCDGSATLATHAQGVNRGT